MVHKAKGFSASARGPQGNPTRGTTHTQRMRRVDRWLLASHASALRHGSPLLVDLGFGAAPVTTVELFERVRALNPRARVTGLEIDPERVREASRAAREGLSFAHGGFEVPTAERPAVIRLFNVLRQYQEADVPEIWERLTSRLAPGGLVVEGTCDELGRRAAWVGLDASGPRTLTLATQLASLEAPSDLAERLPKALIHRNVPGERVHALFKAMDAEWAASTAVAPFGLRQRWRFMAARLKAAGWAVLDDDHRWRQGELTFAWEAVAP
ncbi:class I SAM-dependent methyltransferase [Galactobacter valiniphilus]|nr:class I SAM-dependent methyltransferase [Galactobacter valiniphilus]